MNEKGVCKTALVKPGLFKLDEVGPVDNRPSTDQFPQEDKNMTCDRGHVKGDT